MKLKALKDLTLFGTAYKRGSIIEVATKAAAERLIRSGQARITIDELVQHLSGERMTSPSGKSSDMRVHRG